MRGMCATQSFNFFHNYIKTKLFPYCSYVVYSAKKETGFLNHCYSEVPQLPLHVLEKENIGLQEKLFC